MWVALGFCLANVAAHLFWNRVTEYWIFVASAVAMTSLLVVWLVFEWRRLRMAMTKFYCIAAAFDLIAEGCFQHVHKCTTDNILCTGRMYLVFIAGWLLTAGVSLYRSRTHGAASVTER
jgi:hypothetical protein